MDNKFEKKWTENEINFIKENYENLGPKECSIVIGRTIRACEQRAKKLNIRYKQTKIYYEKENLEKTVKESFSYSGCLKNMGLSTRPGNYDTLKKYIKLYEIDTSHFYTDKKDGMFRSVEIKKKNLNDILVENSPYNRTSLKKRLYDEGLKEKKCEECEQGEIWRGKKISLILDHINGINDDNRLENLRILCPNCNSALETHCRGSKKLNESKKAYCECGAEILKGSKNCEECSHINQRKVENRPSIDILIKEVEEFGYVGTGKKYGVSDNTIRKWIGKKKNYKK